jgi:HEAT repeat protein
MTYYCVECWNEVPKDTLRCLHCGADLEALDNEGYSRKLIRALKHPEPETPVRAAYLLGVLRVREAVPSLIEAAKTGSDPFVRAAAMRALIEIGDDSSMQFLRTLNTKNLSLVERKALDGLAKLQT